MPSQCACVMCASGEVCACGEVCARGVVWCVCEVVCACGVVVCACGVVCVCMWCGVCIDHYLLRYRQEVREEVWRQELSCDLIGV